MLAHQVIYSESDLIEFDCENNVSVEDFCFINDNGNLEKGLATNTISASIIGIVIEKISATKCIIKKSGLQKINNIQIIEGKNYYLSNIDLGCIIDYIPISGVIKFIGIGSKNNELFIDIEKRGIIKNA